MHLGVGPVKPPRCDRLQKPADGFIDFSVSVSLELEAMSSVSELINTDDTSVNHEDPRARTHTCTQKGEREHIMN